MQQSHDKHHLSQTEASRSVWPPVPTNGQPIQIGEDKPSWVWGFVSLCASSSLVVYMFSLQFLKRFLPPNSSGFDMNLFWIVLLTGLLTGIVGWKLWTGKVGVILSLLILALNLIPVVA